MPISSLICLRKLSRVGSAFQRGILGWGKGGCRKRDAAGLAREVESAKFHAQHSMARSRCNGEPGG